MTCLLAIIDFLYFGEARVHQEHLDPLLCLANEVQLEGLMNQFDGGLPAFDAGKEFPLKTVTNLTNSPIQEETPGSQKSSKKSEGEGINIKVCGQKGYSSSIKNHIERIQKDLLFFATNVRKLSNQEIILKDIRGIIKLQCNAKPEHCSQNTMCIFT